MQDEDSSQEGLAGRFDAAVDHAVRQILEDFAFIDLPEGSERRELKEELRDALSDILADHLRLRPRAVAAA